MLPALKDICKHLAIPFKRLPAYFSLSKTHKAISQPLFSTSAVLILAQRVFVVCFIFFLRVRLVSGRIKMLVVASKLLAENRM